MAPTPPSIPPVVPTQVAQGSLMANAAASQNAHQAGSGEIAPVQERPLGEVIGRGLRYLYDWATGAKAGEKAGPKPKRVPSALAKQAKSDESPRTNATNTAQKIKLSGAERVEVAKAGQIAEKRANDAQLSSEMAAREKEKARSAKLNEVVQRRGIAQGPDTTSTRAASATTTSTTSTAASTTSTAAPTPASTTSIASNTGPTPASTTASIPTSTAASTTSATASTPASTDASTASTAVSTPTETTSTSTTTTSTTTSSSTSTAAPETVAPNSIDIYRRYFQDILNTYDEDVRTNPRVSDLVTEYEDLFNRALAANVTQGLLVADLDGLTGLSNQIEVILETPIVINSDAQYVKDILRRNSLVIEDFLRNNPGSTNPSFLKFQLDHNAINNAINPPEGEPRVAVELNFWNTYVEESINFEHGDITAQPTPEAQNSRAGYQFGDTFGVAGEAVTLAIGLILLAAGCIGFKRHQRRGNQVGNLADARERDDAEGGAAAAVTLTGGRTLTDRTAAVVTAWPEGQDRAVETVAGTDSVRISRSGNTLLPTANALRVNPIRREESFAAENLPGVVPDALTSLPTHDSATARIAADMARRKGGAKPPAAAATTGTGTPLDGGATRTTTHE